MLHTAARNTEMLENRYADSYAHRTAPLGEELKRTARRLHDAIARMEEAVALPAPPPAAGGTAPEELEAENASLKAEYRELQNIHDALQLENMELHEQLREMRSKHAAVSQQVTALSAKLEALITRLGMLLEE